MGQAGLEEFEYRARRVERGAHLSQFGRKAKTRLRYYVAPTMNGVEAASGFDAHRPNEGFDRGGTVCPHIWQPCGERDAIAFSEVLSRSL